MVMENGFFNDCWNTLVMDICEDVDVADENNGDNDGDNNEDDIFFQTVLTIKILSLFTHKPKKREKKQTNKQMSELCQTRDYGDCDINLCVPIQKYCRN